MKILIMTEKDFNGYIPTTFQNNLQWDIYLQKSLNAYHLSFYSLQLKGFNFKKFDMAIVIPPYDNPNVADIFKHISKDTTLVVMQEGSKDHWLNYSIKQQMNYINAVNHAAAFLSPNKKDIAFYKVILKIPIHQFSIYCDTLQVKEFGNTKVKKKIPKSMMIGANFDLRGMGLADVYVGSGIVKNIGIPTMRNALVKDNDTFVNEMFKVNTQVYPYVEQKDWLPILNRYQVAVHLANETGTGQLQIQCACLGVPCIGTKDIDLQSYLFPELTIDNSELEEGRILMKRLMNDKTFFSQVMTEAYRRVSELDTIVALPRFKKILEDIYKCNNQIHKRIWRLIK